MGSREWEASRTASWQDRWSKMTTVSRWRLDPRKLTVVIGGGVSAMAQECYERGVGETDRMISCDTSGM